MLRSTVYPGVTAMVEQRLADLGLDVDVSFCPERIAEGKALVELRALPQIVGAAHRARRSQRAEALFRHLAAELDPRLEHRGGRARQAVHEHVALHQVRGREPAVHDRQRLRLDFERIRAAIRRTTRAPPTCPGPGFAAGPCLFKDTMQLAAFNNNNFTLGHASMMINEGLPALHGGSRSSSATTSRR